MAADKPNYNKLLPAQYKTAYSSGVKPPRQTTVKEWHLEGDHPSSSIGVNPLFVQWLHDTDAQAGDTIDVIGYQLYRRRRGYELGSDWKQIISRTAN
ncbi:hypothetical protein EVJ32_09550 [Exiguobacterium sp. SH5S4]|uniref:hypothetical protein n=1 Tax=Exiguobacterium sp. SH5S4 TaxID=2510961 RepID=UPI00103E5A8F|nr:hypothetical protein [Exiguobacterium sp. SH5S4]TCI25559.1 hypothetical protein EVJ32_09550 [Exiguobacterium sp. SH5S4]